jgi:hypothetical protein
MKTMASISLFAIVAMLLAVSAVAQGPSPTPNPPGVYINWNIILHTATADGGSGTAQYSIAGPTLRYPPTPGKQKVFTRLSVECEYLTFPDATSLYVFIGPGRTPGEPFGKLVGQMQVKDGSATLLTARPPVVHEGSTVNVVHDGIAIMRGRF